MVNLTLKYIVESMSKIAMNFFGLLRKAALKEKIFSSAPPLSGCWPHGQGPMAPWSSGGLFPFPSVAAYCPGLCHDN